MYQDISIARTDINDDNPNAIIENNYTSTHIMILQELEMHISIFHLKKQSIALAPNEFSFMVYETIFDATPYPKRG